MGRRPASFTEADVKRALKLAALAGKAWAVEVDTATGKITFRPVSAEQANDQEEWRL